jgi:hypothetical protein
MSGRLSSSSRQHLMKRNKSNGSRKAGDSKNHYQGHWSNNDMNNYF